MKLGMMGRQTYWVEADLAVKDRHVIGYSVWHMTEESGRTCIRHFRNRDPLVSLYLANLKRDDLNDGAKE